MIKKEGPGIHIHFKIPNIQPLVRFFIPTKKWLKVLGGIVVAILVSLVVIGAIYAAPFVPLVPYTMESRQDQIKQDISHGDFSDVSAGLDALEKALHTTEKRIAEWKNIPGLKIHSDSAFAYLEAGFESVQLGRKAIASAETILEPLSDTTLSEEKYSLVLTNVYTNKQELEELKDDISELRKNIESIDVSVAWSSVQDTHKKIVHTIGRVDTAYRKGLNLLEIGLPLMGVPESHEYLLLLQNNAELRPTGGFIGTYGRLVMNNGEIETLFTDNVYTLDDPASKYLKIPSPWPYKYFNNQPYWYLRDSNWSPHFPDAARQAISLYQQEGGEGGIDTVVAITPEFTKDVLSIIGDITIDDTVYTPENFFEIVESHVARDYETEGLRVYDRKEIINTLVQAARKKIVKEASVETLTKIAQAALVNIDERHILLFSNNADIQQGLQLRNWAGEVNEDVVGDYIMVIDTNLGSLKTDPFVERTLAYSLISDEKGKLQGKLDITYKNTASFTWKTTRYRTYTRVYVPKGSLFVDVEGNETNLNITSEYNKTVFGTFISIEPGEEETLTYMYTLPEEVADYIQKVQYSLLVQKQSGTLGHEFFGDIHLNNSKFDLQGILNTDFSFLSVVQ
ncbi:MAG: DUF4012 domain-containing protein [Candidatus Jacksonbacteria bacterium]|jgi:hypothetical protein|nr:DUF4012 domain-containing protein [Candidatus Jacksonbacteria bacterium]MBT6757515.1 DUF4012 domain-containing protein [Candidatus Jacksonbacteria bacterium]MBT7008736.1 DUF4012 domain-containing protein [Candidatus Jacksonbacteria bacterium]MBT7338732.1 DUF4012 domain-containing protein [Candidatus Jacksonbacteria bacterium]